MAERQPHEHKAEHSDDEPHSHEQDHHEHDDHGHDHDHNHPNGILGWLAAVFHLTDHDHEHGDLARDKAFLGSEEGIRTVWLALALLAVTTIIQIAIYLFSGSVALLADTLHNFGDAANSIPLLFAFYLARRIATRRYSYGFARAEDVAGIFIVLSIAISAGIIFWESFQKLFSPEPITNLGWVAAAAIIGFLGNEAVALLQIRVGRRIGSAALVADGLHARTDGLTSLAVLPAVLGSWLGFPIVDAIIGLLIGVAILFITRSAAVSMWYRLMDAIEPELFDQAEKLAEEVTGVKELTRLRMRWMGHSLHAETHIAVEPTLSVTGGHEIAEQVRHALFHEIDKLNEVVVHVEPWAEDMDKHHQLTADHEPMPKRLTD